MTLTYFNNLHCDLTAQHGPNHVRHLLLMARITNRLGCDAEGWTARSRREEELYETLQALTERVSPSDRDCAA